MSIELFGRKIEGTFSIKCEKEYLEELQIYLFSKNIYWRSVGNSVIYPKEIYDLKNFIWIIVEFIEGKYQLSFSRKLLTRQEIQHDLPKRKLKKKLKKINLK